MPPQDLHALYQRLCAEAAKTIVGLEEPFEQLVIALLTGGHILMEGVPGTAKTLMAKTLAALVQADFTRVQFTPDLMPSDILGTSVFDLTSGTFHLRKGPIFTQIFLADEINRAPAKTQAALLEVMEEGQVTLEGERFLMKPPFLVVATKNPIEFEGTYPLPEAELDRFLFKVMVPYVGMDSEVEVLRRYHHGFDARHLEAVGITPVITAEDLVRHQKSIGEVVVEEGILQYIAKIADASRQSRDVALGASPRAATHILLAAKTCAAIRGRDYAIPDDIKYVALPVLRHRLLLKPEAEIEGLDADAVIRRILNQVEVPR